MHWIIDKAKEKTILPRVLRAAVALFVERGIDGTTIKDIAEKSGVSEGALYRHFKSKEELAWSIFSTHVNEFATDLMERVGRGKNSHEKIQLYISTCFEAFDQERDLFTYLIVSEHRELRKFPETHLHPGHVALKLLEEGQKTGELKKMNLYVGSSLLVGSIIRFFIAGMYDRVEGPLKNYENELAESLWKALKSE